MWSEILGVLLILIHLWPAGRAINFNMNGPLQYLARAFKHTNWAHLGANIFGLYQLRDLEKTFGLKKTIQMTFIIWILSSLLLWGFHQLTPWNDRIIVGFSGVIFGLSLILEYTIWKDWKVALALLIRRIVPHLLIPEISFIGHLIGILAGFLYLQFDLLNI